MRERFYRISYNGIGIYQALKESIDMNTWRRYLHSDIFTWLPSHKNYPPNSKSYFTQAGYNMFMRKIFPVLERHLDPSLIIVNRYYIEDIDGVVYRDRYQIITNPDADTSIDTAIESFIWDDLLY